MHPPCPPRQPQAAGRWWEVSAGYSWEECKCWQGTDKRGLGERPEQPSVYWLVGRVSWGHLSGRTPLRGPAGGWGR